jgi:hypothetical protein
VHRVVDLIKGYSDATPHPKSINHTRTVCKGSRQAARKKPSSPGSSLRCCCVGVWVEFDRLIEIDRLDWIWIDPSSAPGTYAQGLDDGRPLIPPQGASSHGCSCCR